MIQSAYDSIIAQVDDSLKSLLDNEATSHVQKKIILCGKLLSSCLGNQLKFEDIKFEDQNNSVSSSIDKVETSIDDNCDAFSFNRVTFDDIIGCDDAKQSIFENIILPFRMPREKQIQIYSGIRQQQANILLYGPPGVGKTILVEAAAHEANATLFTMRPSEILSMYQGESEKHLRQVFEKAQAKQRAIIFFDGKLQLVIRANHCVIL